MRITQKTLFTNFMRDINSNRGQLAKLQSDLSSGKSVRTPSHNPIAFQRARVLEENIRKEEQYQGNIDSGLRQSRLAQGALDEVINRLIDIKSSVVQGATDSAGDSVRENMADEVAGIRESIVSTLNLSYGDRFLFAGTNSGDKPFDLDATVPSGVKNNSNNSAPEVLVGDGVSVEMSVTGVALTNTASGDLFEVLNSIEQALRNNDVQAIGAVIPTTDDLIEHVTDLTAKLGNNINRMEFMYERYEQFRITQKSDISSLVDTDFAQALSDLQRVETTYEAAMAVHSKIFNNNLLDYL